MQHTLALQLRKPSSTFTGLLRAGHNAPRARCQRECHACFLVQKSPRTGTLAATRAVALMRTCCPQTRCSMESVVSRCEFVLQCKPLYSDDLAGNQQALLGVCKVRECEAVRWTCLSTSVAPPGGSHGMLVQVLCITFKGLLLHAEAVSHPIPCFYPFSTAPS